MGAVNAPDAMWCIKSPPSSRPDRSIVPFPPQAPNTKTDAWADAPPPAGANTSVLHPCTSCPWVWPMTPAHQPEALVTRFQAPVDRRRCTASASIHSR